MKRWLWFLVVVCSLAVFSLSGVSAQEDACYTKGGTWDAEKQQCNMQSGVTVNVTYPLELAGTGIAEQTVDDFLNQTRAQFIQSYTPDWSLPGYANYWSMNITYEWFQFSNDIQSIKLNLSDYTGGAHPNLMFQTFTFDLTQQSVLALEDIFQDGVNPWPTLVPMVQQNVTDQLGEAADPQWVQQGTAENPDNYHNWALTPDSLVFFFPPYQVVAYAYGPVTVEIPLTAISSLLKPEFVPQV